MAAIICFGASPFDSAQNNLKAVLRVVLVYLQYQHTSGLKLHNHYKVSLCIVKHFIYLSMERVIF